MAGHFSTTLLKIYAKSTGNSASIWQSYRQKYNDTFFPDTVYICA